MIVTNKDFGWEVIHQQAHGLLALHLGINWHVEKRPVNWIETLVALTEHDDGQDTWEDRHHLTQAGAPMDFNIQSYSVAQARRMIEIALEKSRWNALMVSMHASFLYEPVRHHPVGHQQKKMTEFLDQQQKNQRDWLRMLKMKRQQAEYAYDFIQWCDAFSLILCQDLVPPDGRRLEISPGPDKIPYYVFQRPDGVLRVDPWPYEIDSFTVNVEAFEVRQLSFESDRALYDAIQKADVIQKQWTVERADR